MSLLVVRQRMVRLVSAWQVGCLVYWYDSRYGCEGKEYLAKSFVIRGFIGVGVMRHASHLTQILRTLPPVPKCPLQCHRGACGHGLGALPPPLADCVSTSNVFAFGNGNGDIRDQLRRACPRKKPEET